MAHMVLCLLILLVIPHISETLKCHSCTNTQSHEVCLDDQTIEHCPANLLCSKYSYNIRKDDGRLLKVFARACHSKVMCDNAKKLCRTSELLSDCSIICCNDKDLCNSSTAPLVSGLLVLLCALLGVVTLM